jgi:hypothetical protein
VADKVSEVFGGEACQQWATPQEDDLAIFTASPELTFAERQKKG